MTDDRFACKLIPLLRLLTHSAIADVRREIQIMHHLTGNRNIVELRAAYEDQSAVHLVMEDDEEEGEEGEEEGLSKYIGKELKKLLQCHSHCK
ncbi:uncharacterized protein A4U43_C07F24480 [Asparagus officinalis]|uniref:Protein kinase domain-containing protein n=1 Tax=Asparagus officinalis TaxID=4686 RepID=A0A5P1EEN5_ASPOF|nr:uncharacterized protein A4U43_C07F24480 [Asparagus officinalis]